MLKSLFKMFKAAAPSSTIASCTGCGWTNTVNQTNMLGPICSFHYHGSEIEVEKNDGAVRELFVPTWDHHESWSQQEVGWTFLSFRGDQRPKEADLKIQRCDSATAAKRHEAFAAFLEGNAEQAGRSNVSPVSQSDLKNAAEYHRREARRLQAG